MTINQYASSLAKRNKGRRGFDMPVAQVLELLKQMNEDSEGGQYALIKGGLYVEGSTADSRDDHPCITGIKALAGWMD